MRGSLAFEANDLRAAEADLAKWGDKPQDGDYHNLVHRVGWRGIVAQRSRDSIPEEVIRRSASVSGGGSGS